VVPSTGTTMSITATATLDDDSKISSSKQFRIKNIPAPKGKISGRTGSVRLNKRDVTTSRIIASFDGFVYDLNPNVYSFDLTISGQTPVSVSGDRLDARAIAAVNSAPRKSTITIDNIRVRVQGVSVQIPEADPIIIKLTN
jgi:hypothetical protein